MKTKPFDEKFLAIIGNEDKQIYVLKRVLNNCDRKLLNLDDVKDFIYLVEVLNSVQKAIDIRNASKLCECSLHTYECSPLKIRDVYEYNWKDILFTFETAPHVFTPIFPLDKFKRETMGFEPAEEEVLNVLGINPEKVKDMFVTDSEGDYELVYIDCGENFNGANFTVLRDKTNGKYFVPQNGGAYPLKMTEVHSYVYAEIDGEKVKEEQTMLTTKNKMKTIDDITKRRLVWLNNSGYENLAGEKIFDGISFVWAKGHTLCVRSQKDIENSEWNKSYIAIYSNKEDVEPTKFYSQYRLA